SAVAKPLGMSGGGVEDGGGFEGFVAPGGCKRSSLREKSLDIGGREFAKGAGSFEGLIEDLHAVDAGDDDGSWEMQGVLQALESRNAFALQNVAAADRLHAENADVFLNQHGEDLFFEAAEMRVHDVERHLHSVEREVILVGEFEHAEMDAGVFVTGETSEADF